MNLICPHCQKQVNIAENLAGQTTNCPECRGPFTVPLPPSKPAAPPAPPPAMETATAAYTPPPPPNGTEPEPPPQQPPLPPGNYGRRVALTLKPQILRWIAPACFVIIFFLFFFPWVGEYYGSHAAVRQLGVGVAFGVYDGAKGSESLPSDVRPGVSPFTLLYFLVSLLSLLATGVLLVLTFAPQLVPPDLARLATTWRTLGVAGISLLLFVFLLWQVIFSLPLESKLLGEAEKNYDAAMKSNKDAEKADARVKAERDYGIVRNAVHRTFWFRSVMLLNLIAVLASVADVWLEKRRGRPMPRIVLEC